MSQQDVLVISHHLTIYIHSANWNCRTEFIQISNPISAYIQPAGIKSYAMVYRTLQFRDSVSELSHFLLFSFTFSTT